MVMCFSLAFALQASCAETIRSAQEMRGLSERWAEYYSHAYGVPVDLVMAIIDVESAWNPRAISDKGAAGLMQLMPQTAKRFGVRNRFRLDDNIRGGVAYLAYLSHKFAGDLRLVTAAYYAGESLISIRNLEYCSPDVHRYVSDVAQRYRARRRRALRRGAQQDEGYENEIYKHHTDSLLVAPDRGSVHVPGGRQPPGTL